MNQTKLTRSEWNAIEIPVTRQESAILSFIQRAFHNPTLVENNIKTIYTQLKLVPSPNLDEHLFHKYFPLLGTEKLTKIKKIKKADQIRLDSTTTSIDKLNIYEFILITLCTTKNFFHLQWMLTLHVKHPNPLILQYANRCLQAHVPDIQALTMNSVALLEQNKHVVHADTQLYPHQQELFNIVKTDDAPKLILYIAPTGTGKTMSPIGLSEKYKIIFVCAAKHVGMALLKACVSIGKPCGVAFGCTSVDGVRLHNSAAQKYKRDRKSGAIRKVDNSIGDKIEILVSDLQSYIYAEEYMLTFFPPSDILKYWDEPTISMDEETNELHPIITRNWTSHKIPTIVLSSATLPLIDYSTLTTSEIHTIYSYESSKTIPLFSADNFVVLPHHYCKTQEELTACITHLRANRILLKYIDLGAILDFIKHVQVPFTSMKDITITNIKTLYLDVLDTHVLSPEVVRIPAPSTIHLCSEDAWTCAHGPTMYVVNDVTKIVSYFLKSSAIPADIMNKLIQNLSFNNEIANRVGVLEKDLEDGNKKDEGKEKKMAENRVSDRVKRIQSDISRLQASIKPITLPERFVPNKHDHLKRFDRLDKASTAFTSTIDPGAIERVLGLEVSAAWKVLLMMGIAVFSVDVHPTYMEIVKELTTKECMFAVFATKDFIFGTNYQFANLYIGKDLGVNITQEKIIQTAGRVGRGKQVPYSIRLRDNIFIERLFMPQKNVEGDTMRRLFSR